jgi:hypothetical protein
LLFGVDDAEKGVVSMKKVELAVPEIGLIAVTRGLLGAGIGFLLADRMDAPTRRALGWTLFSIGAVSTVPLIANVVSKRKENARKEDAIRTEPKIVEATH